MKKILYFLSFLIAFLITFIWTFPASSVAGYILTENNISYKDIKGNFLKLKIYEIKTGNIKIPALTLKNGFIYIYAGIDKNNFVRFNLLKRSGIIKLKNLNLKNFQVKPVIEGKLSADKEFYFVDSNIVFKGKGKAFISELKQYGIKNINAKWETNPEKERTKIVAFITGSSINGEFEGYLKFHFLKDVELKGRFTGRFLGSQVNQNINLKSGR